MTDQVACKDLIDCDYSTPDDLEELYSKIEQAIQNAEWTDSAKDLSISHHFKHLRHRFVGSRRPLKLFDQYFFAKILPSLLKLVASFSPLYKHLTEQFKTNLLLK